MTYSGTEVIYMIMVWPTLARAWSRAGRRRRYKGCSPFPILTSRSWPGSRSRLLLTRRERARCWVASVGWPWSCRAVTLGDWWGAWGCWARRDFSSILVACVAAPWQPYLSKSNKNKHQFFFSKGYLFFIWKDALKTMIKYKLVISNHHFLINDIGIMINCDGSLKF